MACTENVCAKFALSGGFEWCRFHVKLCAPALHFHFWVQFWHTNRDVGQITVRVHRSLGAEADIRALCGTNLDTALTITKVAPRQGR